MWNSFASSRQVGMVLALVAGMWNTSTAVANEALLAQVAKGNEANWKAISVIDVSYTATVTMPGVNGDLSKRTTGINRWSWEKDRERVTRRKWTGEDQCVDRFFSQGELRTLQYSESEKLPVIASVTEKPSSAYFRAELAKTVEVNFSGERPALLRHIGFGVGEGRNTLLTLEEVLREWKVTLVENVTEGGNELIHLHVAYPADGHVEVCRGGVLDIYVNPRKGFLVQRLEAIGGLRPAAAGQPPMKATFTVEAIKELDGGLYVPEKVVYQFHPKSDGPHAIRVDVICQEIRINDKVDRTCFDFVFPENARVNESRDDNQEPKIWIWGAGNMPAHEFPTFEKYAAWKAEQNPDGSPLQDLDAMVPWGARISALRLTTRLFSL